MLHLLTEYARRNNLVSGPGFKSKDIKWAVSLDDNGTFQGVLEIGDVDSKRNRGQKFQRCPDFSFSEMKAGGITKSHFLVETAEVVFLLSKNPDDSKLLEKHNFFWDMLSQSGTAEPVLKTIYDRLHNSEDIELIRKDLEKSGAKPNDKVTFRFGKGYPVELDTWHDWWAEFRSQYGSEDSSQTKYRSFLSGKLVKPLKVQPKIGGLSDVGGQPSGDSLMSFKQDSFCSYNLKQALNAVTSEDEAYIYRNALNHLITKTGIRLINTKVIHWFKEKISEEDDLLPWLISTPEKEELNAHQKARQLLDSIRSGKRPDLQNNTYYAMTLSGAAGRVMIRDWIEGQFEELVGNINNWFDDLQIVKRNGSDITSPPKFYAILGASVRKLDELNEPYVAKMWRVAVKSEPIPYSALAQILHRIRFDVIEDKPANHAGMGLLKAYHIRKDKLNRKEPSMGTYLNEDHPSAAYQCGRLMAILAALQRRALGDVGAGIVQRYYAAASTTPALILGRLTTTSQHHLNKIGSPGLVYWYEDKIANIWNRIKDSVPATLTLEEQSLFALGYYQQMADLRKKKELTPEENMEAQNE